MKISVKRGLTLATAAVAIIALSACTSGGGASPSASSAPKVPGTGWVSADAASVPAGGSLTLAVDATPANWNLNNLDAGTVDDNTLAGVFLPSFVTIKQDGSWEVDKDFADSVALKSDSPQVVEVKINPKAVWSDGTPMSYEDFAATWKSLNGKDEAYAPISTNVWSDISSVTAGTNAQDVLLTFKNKNADWPSILGAIWPKWLGDTPAHFNSSWATGPYAADGKSYVSGSAFVLSKFDPTGQVVTFAPNPKWWGEKPKLDSLIFKTVSRAGLAQAYANKEIDVLNTYSNADNFATAKKRTDGEIQRSLSTTYRHITLNGTASVFKDVKVRTAFAKALNRSVIAQARLAPVGSPTTLLGNLIYLPGQDGYADDAQKVIGYDTAGAKKILEDAGYKAGSNGIYAKGGKALSVRFVIPSDNPNSAQVAQQVQAQEKAAGIDVKIDVVPSDDFFTKYITTKTRDFDATYFAWQGTPFPVSSTESIFYPASSGQNYPGVTDKSLGKDFAGANGELDPAKRLKLAQAIDKKLVALVTTIPLFPETFVFGVKKGLVNYGPTQFQTVFWQNVGFTK
ncbi:MAG: glutathione transport system substrate-binding protein [Microbacteriaceae bacterium]|jgi:peptide/nickel transport system substrate-binding protein|nr:glutathione transport system substrate-binding protein [Microbacteriaceae bacterium]